jgi:hypothetical protein
MAIPISKVVNSIGLVMDVVGVFLLFKFGLPEDVRRKGQGYLLLEETDQIEIAKAKRYDCWARIALLLVVLGFMTQLVSNFL